MRRLSAASSILAVSVLAIGGLASATVAKDEKPLLAADSPVVGAWELRVDGDDPANAPAEMIFHADGTYMQAIPGMVGVGSWVPTGPNTGALTFVQYGAFDDTGSMGHDTVRATFEVAPDGQTLTAAFTIDVTSPDGTSTGQMGPGTGTATRIVVEEMAPAAPTGPESGDDAVSGSQTLDVTLADFSVAISPTTVQAGEPITFAVTNSGAQTHELVLEKAGDDDIPLSADGVESEIEDITPGALAEMTWTITEPGTYQLACHIPGHFEQGMVAAFEVVQ